MWHARLKLHQVTRGYLCAGRLCVSLSAKGSFRSKSHSLTARDSHRIASACLVRAGQRADEWERIRANSSANGDLSAFGPAAATDNQHNLQDNAVRRPVINKASYDFVRASACARAPDGPLFQIAGRRASSCETRSLANPQPIGINSCVCARKLLRGNLQIGFGPLQRWTV